MASCLELSCDALKAQKDWLSAFPSSLQFKFRVVFRHWPTWLQICFRRRRRTVCVSKCARKQCVPHVGHSLKLGVEIERESYLVLRWRKSWKILGRQISCFSWYHISRIEKYKSIMFFPFRLRRDGQLFQVIAYLRRSMLKRLMWADILSLDTRKSQRLAFERILFAASSPGMVFR